MARRSKSKRSRHEKESRSERSPAAKTGFWERLTVKQRHLISAAFLLIIALAFFAPANFQGKTLAGGDQLQSLAMAKSMRDYREATGEDGLWSPNLFSGMPGYFIAYRPVVPQIDDVFRQLRKLAYPTFYFLLLVFGVYTLVYLLTARSLAALVSSVIFGLTTYIPIILAAGHSSKFIVLSWIPWVLVAFVLIRRRPGVLTGFVFAAVLASALRGGHVQIIYNAFFLIGIWWLVDFVGAVRAGQSRAALVSTGWLVLGTGLALLMVAQPFLPQMEFKQFSIRGGGGVPVVGESGASSESGLGFDYAMGWSQGWFELLTYLIANAMGGGSGTYWGAKAFTSGPHYLGGIALALALIAVLGRRSKLTTALASALVLITLFALGENAYFINRPFFEYVPLFNSFRAPEIWLHMAELCIAILAGIGMAWILDVGARSRGREGSSRGDSGSGSGVMWASVGGLLGVTLLLLVAAPTLRSFERSGEREQIEFAAARQNNSSPDNPQVQAAVDRYLGELKAEREDIFETDAVRTVTFLLLAAVGLFLFLSGRLWGSAFAALLILLVTVDLWGVGKRFLSDDSYFEGSFEAQVPEYDFDRFIKGKVEEEGGPGHFRTISLENSPTDWARPAFHYEVASGYNAAKLRVYQDLIEHLGLGGRGVPPNETMMDLTATRFIVSARQVPGTRAVFADRATGLAVFERPRERWEDRTLLVDSVVVREDASGVVEELKREGFDRREYAVVLGDPGELGRIDSASTNSVALTRYDAHHAEWQVRTDRQRLLVTSEIYYPAGWIATIDGDPAEILQVNHAFRGVIVPAGEHAVAMEFRPDTHDLGVLISLIATIFVYLVIVVACGLWFARRWRETRQVS